MHVHIASSSMKVHSTKEDTMDVDAPCLESYNGRCKDVDYHGQRQVNRLGDADDIPSDRNDLKVTASMFGN
jgi:hypothetical protein